MRYTPKWFLHTFHRRTCHHGLSPVFSYLLIFCDPPPVIKINGHIWKRNQYFIKYGIHRPFGETYLSNSGPTSISFDLFEVTSVLRSATPSAKGDSMSEAASSRITPVTPFTRGPMRLINQLRLWLLTMAIGFSVPLYSTSTTLISQAAGQLESQSLMRLIEYVRIQPSNWYSIISLCS